MKSVGPRASILGASLLLFPLFARAIPAQECILEANDHTNEAAAQIQNARGMEGAAEQAPYYQRALELLEQAIAESPDDAAALWLFGEVYVSLGDYVAADSMLDRLLEVMPECEEQAEQTRRVGWVNSYNEGLRAFAAGDMTTAVAAFEKANIIQQDARSFNNLAYIYAEQGEVERAIETYRNSVELATEPELRRAAVINLAELLKSVERLGEALEIYDDYTASYPDDVFGRINHAVLLAEAGEQERSAEILADLTQREDYTFAEWNELGVGLLRVGAFGEAIPVFTRARELEPFDKYAMTNLVDAQIESRQYAEALPLADTLVAWYPYAAIQYPLLASCLSRTGRPGDALVHLQAREALPFEFEGVHMTRGSGGSYVVQGQVVGRGGLVGERLAVPVEFLGQSGDVIATGELEFLVPPEGVSRAIRLEAESEVPFAGFRYSRADSQSPG
ncbi:MAG: tetratricopeptide repeat protein [Gemmatimonadota bacterium]|nr:MAG: tetratricopeptide repeat protein [Gemmatimonadota bacterium]